MISGIRKSLLQFVFSGAYMKRWNDKLRLMELIEIDKQAHKMITAWLLCRLKARELTPPEALALEADVVEGGIFDYLFRLVITDIKPPILYRIKENAAHYQRLAAWAVGEVEPHLRPLSGEFWQRFTTHVMQPKPRGLAADILGAAHLYASVWEFRRLRPLNDDFDDELPDIDERFREQLEEYRGLPGMPELIAGLERPSGRRGGDKKREGASALARFANLCGQLRFQKRWSQTPRVPETSVMGHMFVVGCYAYFLSYALGGCRARRVNAFFCGLFHDLPELLTRDIISPVKKSVDDLEKLIREYEKTELDRRVFEPLRRDGLADVVERLGYYLGLDLEDGSEFDNTVRVPNGKGGLVTRRETYADFHMQYNKDEFDPKGGEAVKICDTLAAYIEAYTAIRNGITSDHIQQAFWRMREQNAKKTIGNVHIGALFTDFD